MSSRPWVIAVAVLASSLAACSKPRAVDASAAAPPPYVLSGTEVRTLHAKTLGRDYQLFVSLPVAYARRPGHRFPVLFVTDADYAFPLLRSIVRRVGAQGAGLEDMVIVGLSYAAGDTPEYSRRRDYTPTADGDKAAVSDMPGRPVTYGEGPAYQRFIAEQVFPLVAGAYRVDMHDKTYLGHSYGGLLGVQMLLSDPAMFEHYIIGSPSLWFGHRVMFDHERAYAATHTDLPADVFMAVGGYETINPGDSRYNKTVDMVGDLRRLQQALAARRYPGLKLQMQVIQDEDHLSVFPAIATRGMKAILKPRTGTGS
ncbi:MAG: alpha/beta hydrolase-fold protein [Caulobacteraceae bacterium]